MTIFSKVHEDTARVVRTAYVDSKFEIVMKDLTPATLVEGNEEAERMLLELATPWAVEDNLGYMGKKITIYRAANMIANRTRRGAGNLVLIAQEDNWSELTEEDFPGMEVAFHPLVEQGTAYVMYRAENDGPAFLISKDGDLYFSPLEEDANCLAKAEDYVVKIDWRAQEA